MNMVAIDQLYSSNPKGFLIQSNRSLRIFKEIQSETMFSISDSLMIGVN